MAGPKEPRMRYTCVTTLKEIKSYLAGAELVAFDFETAPT